MLQCIPYLARDAGDLFVFQRTLPRFSQVDFPTCCRRLARLGKVSLFRITEPAPLD